MLEHVGKIAGVKGMPIVHVCCAGYNGAGTRSSRVRQLCRETSGHA
jgi:hypothetical protein